MQTYNLDPSPDDVTDLQFLAVSSNRVVHVTPESALVYMYSLLAQATKLTPSEEDATEYQFLLESSFLVSHVTP